MIRNSSMAPNTLEVRQVIHSLHSIPSYLILLGKDQSHIKLLLKIYVLPSLKVFLKSTQGLHISER